MTFDDLFIKLREYVTEIKSKFIEDHIQNTLASPDEYSLDVKSFCILCHAAFEEFVESIALQIMSQSIKKYKNEIKISKPLISLMHFVSNHDNYLEKDADTLEISGLESIFDYNRKKMDEIKSIFSNQVYSNHGVSLKYLRKLMMPVSLDIPKNVNWSNSLERLANERGSYAHKFLDEGRVKQSIEPEEAEVIVNDCLDLCSELKERAKTLLL